jgi:hypothetical protein
MQDTELLIALAEIAGVFVGFAALISVRGAGTSEAHEVTFIRVVVWTAVWVVIAALAPVVISRYDITGHELWLVSSLVVLALFHVMWIASRRTPEHKVDMASYPRTMIVEYTFLMGLLMVPMNIALILVVLGLFPDQEPALYLTAVVLVLFLGASVLLSLVYSQGRRQTA